MKPTITKLMKEQISNHREYFLSRTCGGHIINYLNGFVAVGIFNTPQKHLGDKAANVLWIYQIGFNKTGSKIIEIDNVELTLDEGEDLLKCLKIAIKRLKNAEEVD